MDVLDYIDTDSDDDNESNPGSNFPSKIDEKKAMNVPIEARTKIIENNDSKTSRRRRRKKKKSGNTDSRSSDGNSNNNNKSKAAGTFTNVVSTNTITSNAGNFEFVPPYRRVKWRRLAEADVQAD